MQVLAAVCFICTRCWAELWGAKKCVGTQCWRPAHRANSSAHSAIDSSAQTHLNSRKNLQGHKEKGKEVARAESRTENLDKFYKDGNIEIKTKVAEEETWIQ